MKPSFLLSRNQRNLNLFNQPIIGEIVNFFQNKPICFWILSSRMENQNYVYISPHWHPRGFRIYCLNVCFQHPFSRQSQIRTILGWQRCPPDSFESSRCAPAQQSTVESLLLPPELQRWTHVSLAWARTDTSRRTLQDPLKSRGCFFLAY